MLERKFDAAMMGIYKNASKEANYKATRFFEMLQKHKGIETAKILIQSNTVSDGYTALYQRGRLDLTVEALIYENPEWHELFTPEEIKICENRLREYSYIK
jgi:hypothetical protein